MTAKDNALDRAIITVRTGQVEQRAKRILFGAVHTVAVHTFDTGAKVKLSTEERCQERERERKRERGSNRSGIKNEIPN